MMYILKGQVEVILCLPCASNNMWCCVWGVWIVFALRCPVLSCACSVILLSNTAVWLLSALHHTHAIGTLVSLPHDQHIWSCYMPRAMVFMQPLFKACHFAAGIHMPYYVLELPFWLQTTLL